MHFFEVLLIKNLLGVHYCEKLTAQAQLRELVRFNACLK
jgi:hypothetical protein